MKTLLLTIVTSLFLAGCAGIYHRRGRHWDGRVPAYARVYAPNGQQRALVCHKGKKTMVLPTPALNGHMRHGDHFGSCARYRHDDRGRRGRGNRGNGRRR